MSTKPKTWDGPEQKPKSGRKAKALAEPFESIPDEADDQPEQTTLGDTDPDE